MIYITVISSMVLIFVASGIFEYIIRDFECFQGKSELKECKYNTEDGEKIEHQVIFKKSKYNIYTLQEVAVMLSGGIFLTSALVQIILP